MCVAGKICRCGVLYQVVLSSYCFRFNRAFFIFTSCNRSCMSFCLSVHLQTKFQSCKIKPDRTSRTYNRIQMTKNWTKLTKNEGGNRLDYSYCRYTANCLTLWCKFCGYKLWINWLKWNDLHAHWCSFFASQAQWLTISILNVNVYLRPRQERWKHEQLSQV